MSKFKNNLPNNDDNYFGKKSCLKAISLASLSSLFVTLTFNNLYQVSATPQVGKTFYGSNGQRPMIGSYSGNTGVGINLSKPTMRPSVNASKFIPGVQFTSGIGSANKVGTTTSASNSIGGRVNAPSRVGSITSTSGSTGGKVNAPSRVGSTASSSSSLGGRVNAPNRVGSTSGNNPPIALGQFMQENLPNQNNKPSTSTSGGKGTVGKVTSTSTSTSTGASDRNNLITSSDKSTQTNIDSDNVNTTNKLSAGNKNGSVFTGTLDIEVLDDSSSQASSSHQGSIRPRPLNSGNMANDDSADSVSSIYQDTTIPKPSNANANGSSKPNMINDPEGVRDTIPGLLIDLKEGTKLNKKKILMGTGVSMAALATLGLGLGLGLGLNNNEQSKNDPDNKVTPPALKPVPSSPPAYSTMVSHSADGNLFVDSKAN